MEHNKNTVHIGKRSEIKIHLSCSDSGILREVYEHFTFFAEGYKFHPMFKNRMWDGKIRLFSLRDNTMPFGLLANLIEFLKRMGYSFKMGQEFLDVEYPTKESITDFVANLKLTVRGEIIQPHDYQVEGIRHSLNAGRAILISPTGSGKSLIIYCMIRWFLQNYTESILVVVPTTSLVHQLKKDFEDYSSSDNSFLADERTSMIMSGFDKNPKKKKIRITLDNGEIKEFFPSDVVVTKRGIKKASELSSEDEIE